jgi:dihydrofolate reductase
MRNLIFAINISLDGCCDHTKMIAGEDVHEYFTQLLREADTLVYGRLTYQLMVPFWPDIAKTSSGPTKALNDFADAFDSVKEIVVFSSTLNSQDVGNKTTIVRGNVEYEILNLKQQSGKDIVLGGVDLPSQVIELGLVDEFRFVVHPVIVGEGRRLFDDLNLSEKLQLRFVDSKTLASGFVALRYLKQ